MDKYEIMKIKLEIPIKFDKHKKKQSKHMKKIMINRVKKNDF